MIKKARRKRKNKSSQNGRTLRYKKYTNLGIFSSVIMDLEQRKGPLEEKEVHLFSRAMCA